ncbi:MAG: hypothetical protein NT007_18225 [Candidatus Kapabacteria bacterium]|nr:hypothetical protein [Candidatus Kapabacteria bacterium]
MNEIEINNKAVNNAEIIFDEITALATRYSDADYLFYQDFWKNINIIQKLFYELHPIYEQDYVELQEMLQILIEKVGPEFYQYHIKSKENVNIIENELFLLENSYLSNDQKDYTSFISHSNFIKKLLKELKPILKIEKDRLFLKLGEIRNYRKNLYEKEFSEEEISNSEQENIKINETHSKESAEISFETIVPNKKKSREEKELEFQNNIRFILERQHEKQKRLEIHAVKELEQKQKHELKLEQERERLKKESEERKLEQERIRKEELERKLEQERIRKEELRVKNEIKRIETEEKSRVFYEKLISEIESIRPVKCAFSGISELPYLKELFVQITKLSNFFFENENELNFHQKNYVNRRIQEIYHIYKIYKDIIKNDFKKDSQKTLKFIQGQINSNQNNLRVAKYELFDELIIEEGLKNNSIPSDKNVGITEYNHLLTKSQNKIERLNKRIENLKELINNLEKEIKIIHQKMQDDFTKIYGL